MSLLNADEIAKALLVLPGWDYDRTRSVLSKTYKFKNFTEAFAFMSRCAEKADEMDHHPEWFNVYNRVDVALTTHDANGVTPKDIELARFMESLL